MQQKSYRRLGWLAGLAVAVLAVWLCRRDIFPSDAGDSESTAIPARQQTLNVRKPKMSREQMAAALALALNQPDSVARQAASKPLAYSIGTVDPEKALELIEHSEDAALRAELRHLVLRLWAGRDPVAALQFAQGLSGRQEQCEAARAVFRAWTEREVAGALEWFEQNRESLFHQEARDTLVEALGRDDAQSVLPQLEQSVSESARHELYGPLLRQWAATDSEAAASAVL
jgi:hypothetical protein